MRNSAVQVVLTIGGEQIVPEEITNLLGVLPDRSWRRCYTRSDPVLSKLGGWQTRSTCVEYDSYLDEVHWSSIRARLFGRELTIRSISERFRVAFDVLIDLNYIEKRMQIPPLYFSRETFRFISDCGGVLDFEAFH